MTAPAPDFDSRFEKRVEGFEGQIPDQKYRFPEVPAQITFEQLKQWLAVLGLPLEHLSAGSEELPSVRVYGGAIEAHYYAVRPDPQCEGREVRFAVGDMKKAAMHTVVIPVVE